LSRGFDVSAGRGEIFFLGRPLFLLIDGTLYEFNLSDSSLLDLDCVFMMISILARWYINLILLRHTKYMKKEQEEIKKFIERTFTQKAKTPDSKTQNSKKKNRSKKKKGAVTELRLKIKVPEDEIAKQNLQILIENR
jgi:hypothetical protein